MGGKGRKQKWKQGENGGGCKAGSMGRVYNLKCSYRISVPIFVFFQDMQFPCPVYVAAWAHKKIN